jgi:hypothetical protein
MDDGNKTCRFKLDNLKRSIDYCHPQVPSLAVETALLIERHIHAGNIDEVFADKSFEELNDATYAEKTIMFLKYKSY